MTTLYLICLLVGGFFVALSLLGGSGSGDADVDVDLDLAAEADVDVDHEANVAEADSAPGLVDLFSVRALFLFAAFFGLTGVSLSLLDTGEPATAMLSVLVGLVVGLGGNYVIKRVGYERVSSDVREADLRGQTARVVVPFRGESRGKISLVAGGQRMQILARSFAGEMNEVFQSGDEVVVVRMEGSVAEVVKPD